MSKTATFLAAIVAWVAMTASPLLTLAGDTEVAKPILTQWGSYIDAIDQEHWSDYVHVFHQLQDMGFTHAGVHIDSTAPDADPTIRRRIQARILELRTQHFNIALHHSAGHRFLTQPDQLDPAVHPSNGQNLKYFDSLNFDASRCNLGIDCSVTPDPTALDPAYDGIVWQKEVSLLRRLVALVHISSEDLVLFDAEIWGGNLGWKRWGYFYLNHPTGGVYPNLLMNSVGRYTGDRTHREAQFFEYWKQRTLDLKTAVKQYSLGSRTLFFGENIPDPGETIPYSQRACVDFRGYAIASCLCSASDEQVVCPVVSFDPSPGWPGDHDEITYFPVGIGDAPAPLFYFLPDLGALQRELDRGNNFRGSYPWIQLPHKDTAGHTHRWDPQITQKAGYLMHRSGIPGAIVYPGPYDQGIPIEEYLAHARALADGLIRGMDPAPTVSAGADHAVTLSGGKPTASATVTLTGAVNDDGLPAGGVLSVLWSQVGGKAPVRFGSPLQATTRVTFTQADAYVLRLTASDGALTASDDVVVIVSPHPPVVVGSQPASGYIDPREDLDDVTGMPRGRRMIKVTFDQPVFDPATGGPVQPSDFVLTESGSKPPPSVLWVWQSPPLTYTMLLSRLMTPGECTTLIPQVAGAEGARITPSARNRVALGFLPGDVNANGVVNALDLGGLRAQISTGPATVERDDINRDGQVTKTDYRRALELFTGVQTTRRWIGALLPSCPAE